MGKFFIKILAAVLLFTGNAHSEQVSDEVLLRRTYLTLAGRVPTLEETKNYLQSPDHDKLVVNLLKSEDYVQSFYNYYADLFRIKANIDGVGFLKFYPYIDWVKNNIRENKPYDQMVREMLTAEGKMIENPAAGYYARDNGMPLDNFSYTMQVFLGKDLSCAQCHDDPFSHWTQMDFYQSAAFFAQNTTRDPSITQISRKIDEEIKQIRETDRVDNAIRQLLRGNGYGSFKNQNAVLKLPHDYRYDDAEPNSPVSPYTPFGDVIKSGDSAVFAEWIVKQHDFSVAASNRLWAFVTGDPLITPLANVDIAASKNEELSRKLANKFKELNYDVRLFLHFLVTSNVFKQENGIKTRRLTAEQAWDSLVTIAGGVPMPIDRSGYSDFVNLDLASLTGQGAIDAMEEYRDFTRKLPRPKQIGSLPIVRASDLERRTDFLKKFGASERELIDSSSVNGSSGQVLLLINGEITNSLSHKDSILMKDPSIENIFLSTLTRLPTLQEKSALRQLSAADIVWAVINSNEFLFIQ